MKCVYLAHRVPFPPNKGEKLRTYHQIKNLLECGVEVTVLCPIEDEKEFELCEQLQARHPQCTVEAFMLPPKLLRYGRALLYGQSVSEANFFSPALQQRLSDIVAHKDTSAVVATASSMTRYITKLANILRQTQTKMIMDFMDLDSNKWVQYATQAGLPMRWVYQREASKVASLEAMVGEQFDAAFLVAETETELFIKAHPATRCKVISIGNGIDPNEFRAPDKPPAPLPPKLFFAGVMDYTPNIDAVMWFCKQVWPSITARWPDATFTIAGMNPTTEVKQLGQQPGIEVTGFVDDILPYFQRANLFVAPFRIARGIQNKILQAMACGLPVVATSMGAEGIIYENGENLLVADSPEDFAQQIVTVLSQSEQFNAVRDAGLATIESHYSWSGQLAPLRMLLGIENKESQQQASTP